ncbi:hypothetical protein BYT27DRAFT_6744309 [Phlegmacium glaucopus]|nr:hypothetical protein BYT27DRAFT_6744309 [Phlegmacium glaucopus]
MIPSMTKSTHNAGSSDAQTDLWGLNIRFFHCRSFDLVPTSSHKIYPTITWTLSPFRNKRNSLNLNIGPI